MSRKRTGSGKYGIAVTHPDGVVGWLTNPDATTELHDTPEEAHKSLKRWLKDTRYTWTLPMEVREYYENKV